MFDFERIEIEVVFAVPPKLVNSYDPASVHRFDVWPLPSNMAVLRSVIIADDKMRDVRGEVIFVYATKLSDTLGDDCLQRIVSATDEKSALPVMVLQHTLPSVGMLVQHTTVSLSGAE
jgi:hypothetical protein